MLDVSDPKKKKKKRGNVKYDYHNKRLACDDERRSSDLCVRSVTVLVVPFRRMRPSDLLSLFFVPFTMS